MNGFLGEDLGYVSLINFKIAESKSAGI